VAVDPRQQEIEENDNPVFSDRIGEVDPICLKNKAYYYRTIDGSCNWLKKGEYKLGATGGNFGRDRPAHFKSGTYSVPREGPNPRELSNLFFKNNRTRHFPHTPYLTGFVEFLVHELMFSPNSFEPSDTYNIPIPKCDSFFDPTCTGTKTIPFWRTKATEGTGINSPRENTNHQTIWIDGSSIYGTTPEETNTLRSHKDGKMVVDEFGYPPMNTFGFNMKSRPGQKDKVFAAGDARANQDWLLMSYHTLFLREHNRLCDEIKKQHPTWGDERLFQTTRVAISAKIQMIGGSYLMSYYTNMPGLPTPLSIFQQWYGETLLTINPLVRYPWKRVLSPAGTPNTLPQEFSIGYRWHDLIPTNMAIVDKEENIKNWVSLAETAFDAETFKKTSLQAVLRGMGATTIPGFLSGTQDAFRNIKWNLGDPTFNTGFDLVAWAIEHERERGLPTYNEYIKDYDGKPVAKPKKTWADFTSNKFFQQELARLYKSPNEVDITVAQELDEQVWPHTSIPLSMMIINFFTLFKGSISDRFAVNYNIFHCFIEGTPLSCKTNNGLQDLIWEPHFNPVLFPNGKWFNKFWWSELDVEGQGSNILRNMIVQNTDIECMQANPLFTISESNPVLCNGPRYGPPPKADRNTFFG
jgi:peroxidase